MLYNILDWFFVVFHSLLVIFNVFGWVRKAWLRYNLVTLLLTGGSWIFLGLFYGMGYCPLTDWHWTILSNLGKEPSTSSYIAYLFNRVIRIEVSNSVANSLTLWVYVAALGISITLNTRQYIKRKRNTTDPAPLQ